MGKMLNNSRTKYYTRRWRIFSLVLLGVVCFQVPTYSGTWSQTTQAGFTLSNVDSTTNGGDITLSGAYSTDSKTVLLMHFDEGIGDPQDSSGKGNNGANNGAAYTASGKFGNALSFDGVNGFIALPAITNPTDFTIECWIKSDTYEVLIHDRPFVASDSWVSGKICFSQRPVDEDNFTIFTNVYGQGPDQFYSNKKDFKINTWYHVAWTHNHTTKTDNIYVNGVLDATQKFDTYPDVDFSDLNIGLFYVNMGERCFSGIIDEVRISNVVRTSFSIANLQKIK